MRTDPRRNCRLGGGLEMTYADSASTCASNRSSPDAGGGSDGVILMLVAGMSLPVGAATIVPELWTAGGLSAGTDSAGQAARIASDASGNVAVVSGPSGGRDLAVTSYTADGSLRWRQDRHPGNGHVRRRLGGRCAQRRLRRDRAQPGLSRPSDCQHHAPVRLERDAPVAGGLLRVILPCSCAARGRCCGQRLCGLERGRQWLVRAEVQPRRYLALVARPTRRPAAAMPSPPRWR